MKVKFIFILFLASVSILYNCKDDDALWGENVFVAAFKNPSENLAEEQTEMEIEIVFSDVATNDGWIEIDFYSDQLNYGDEADFVTYPMAQQNRLKVPFLKNSQSTTFVLKQLSEVLPDEDKSVEFSIVSIELEGKQTKSQGNKSVIVSFSQSAALGGTLSPEVGGATQPNQVYVELRTKKETKIRRDTWELGFYSGDEFRVKLNGAIYMFAGKLSSNDMNNISMDEVNVLKSKMAFLLENSNVYVDDPTGIITGTAIEGISENDHENHVFLLNMGYEIGTDEPEVGGVAIAGEQRGYKKIRILKHGDAYVMQYADLEESEFQEVIVPKSEGFNFTFYSLANEGFTSVEPQSDRWDLNFTVKTEVEQLPGAGLTAYGYSDYVETNTLGNVKAYRVFTDEFNYDDYSIENIDESKLLLNQRVIGASWRKVTPPNKHLYDNIFYIIKDAEGNFYKLKFTGFENENGVRGYPQFKYDLLK